MIDPTTFDAARSWLGNRWLLAEPVNKPNRCHVRTLSMSKWKELNQQIARILAGSEHV